jgi:hypothetical protein
VTERTTPASTHSSVWVRAFEGDSMPSSPTMAPTGNSMPDSTRRKRPLTM